MTRVGEWRALEIVEKIGRPQAIQILRDLANGTPGQPTHDRGQSGIYACGDSDESGAVDGARVLSGRVPETYQFLVSIP